MRKLANLISAYIYIFIVKKFTDQSKEDILEGENIEKFGANLVLSSFVFLLLFLFALYIFIWSFQGVVTIYQK